MEQPYDPKAIESKWQQRWLDERLFAVQEDSPKQKMYVLDMFPYPSGDGLHVGHVKIYTASDVVSRYLRMKGFNVLHPTGWDAFGLPTENSAIKYKIQPAVLTERNIERFRGQMRRLGLSYDWDREINTTDPNYYKWTQWIFLQLYKMGLAYEATVPINWCPKDKTGLANEEVVDGCCERCGTPVEQRPMRQWMLRITKYADRLLEGLGGVDWPNSIKELQKNWIGRSEGVEILFPVDGSAETLPVFTTRADTIYGVTYIVLSPQHPLLEKIVTPEQKEAVVQYQTEHSQTAAAREEAKEKTGVFTGSYGVHPFTQAKLPIWVADYVLMNYGTGAIMAVPAHDARDFELAKKYNLPVQQVVVPMEAKGEASLPYTGEGVLINSGQFDGQSATQAQEGITSILQLQQKAKKTTHYTLRDWVFSRQRYWGEPIPIIHCEKCGVVPVREEDLPVTLPPVANYEPTGTGESPLAAIKEWVEVKCPTCPNMARRETNTMPQWAGSSWYWLRYLDPHFTEGIADAANIAKWLPVDLYVGGAEHAVLHLLYARFWHKALFDAGVTMREEPFQRFRAVGLLLGEDGQKMSKSRGNVVNPDQVVEEYGADTLRVYEMFMGPFDQPAAWDTHGIKGVQRFLRRVWERFEGVTMQTAMAAAAPMEIQVQIEKTIKKVAEGTEQFKFNTSIAALMELLNSLEPLPAVDRKLAETYVLLLAPYAPHICEELWQRFGHAQSLMYQAWPLPNEAVLKQAALSIPVQVNSKVRAILSVPAGLTQNDLEKTARAMPNVQKYLAGKEVVKIVFVADKLLNFVVK
jgi:leucyl-tRNA synthetase